MYKRIARRAREFLVSEFIRELRNLPKAPEPVPQKLLELEYRRMADEGKGFARIHDAGFKAYSQTDEDGILLYLFSVIGTENRSCAEICAGDGLECNTANLILNHGWHGLLVDGNPELVAKGEAFYRKCAHSCVFPPRFIQAWVTRENVNELLTRNGFSGDIDLLSLDLDGVDYWIWEAINVISPRVVVLEYQDILGSDRSWTVPYADQFDSSRYPFTNGMPNFCGASLAAFTKLAKNKGYRLVGVNRYGFNAFYVRNGIGELRLPEIAVADCFSHPKTIEGMRERFPTVANCPWVEV